MTAVIECAGIHLRFDSNLHLQPVFPPPAMPAAPDKKKKKKKKKKSLRKKQNKTTPPASVATSQLTVEKVPPPPPPESLSEEEEACGRLYEMVCLRSRDWCYVAKLFHLLYGRGLLYISANSQLKNIIVAYLPATSLGVDLIGGGTEDRGADDEEMCERLRHYVPLLEFALLVTVNREDSSGNILPESVQARRCQVVAEFLEDIMSGFHRQRALDNGHRDFVSFPPTNRREFAEFVANECIEPVMRYQARFNAGLVPPPQRDWKLLKNILTPPKLAWDTVVDKDTKDVFVIQQK
jgi:hypothetical protein